ncbi:MAG: HEAT repeat domain-containing protein [Planctomycetes bacterium]|nr:HEAT repeat domain-containing protein [Planctomycetota bacterium]
MRTVRQLGVLLLTCAWLCVGCRNANLDFTDQRQAQLEHRATALLLRAAQSDDGLVHANAIEALVKLAPQENLPIFREAVTSEAPLVRFAGCVALGQARDAASLRALWRLINADPDARVRLSAAFAAARCGDTNSGRVLAMTLSDHPDEKLRADAAYLIGELGEPKAMRRLKLAAAREDSGYVTVQIESAMAKLGDRDSLDQLVEYTLKSDAVTVLLALQTLVELADPTTRKTLEYRLHSEADYLQARLIAARGLGKLGVVEGYDLAIKSLTFSAKDDNETMQVRSNAALALGAIGQARALPALQRLAETKDDARTQVAACFAICQITKAAP